MMKIGIFTVVSILLPYAAGTGFPSGTGTGAAVGEADESIKWFSWEEAMDMQQQSAAQKVFLSIYTDWCGWCKRMDEQTFSHGQIAGYLNQHFLPVKLNAEYREPLSYRGKSYEYVKNGKRGYHELAARLLRGRLSYPSIVFLDEQGEVIQAIVGYKSPRQLERILTYFSEDHYKTTPWAVYERTYQPTISEEDD